jgi:hypothetical protein
MLNKAVSSIAATRLANHLKGFVVEEKADLRQAKVVLMQLSR